MAGSGKSPVNSGFYVIVGGLIVAGVVAYFVSHGGNPLDADITTIPDQSSSAPATEK